MAEVPDDILVAIFIHLDVRELACVRLVDKRWSNVFESQVIWQTLYERKAIRTAQRYSLDTRISWMMKYKLSLLEDKREFILRDELVGKPWSFRFKEGAGEEWVAQCLWWRDGQDARQVVFHEDGILRPVPSETANFPDFYVTFDLFWLGSPRLTTKCLVNYLTKRCANKKPSKALLKQWGNRTGNAVVLSINGIMAPVYHVLRSPTGNAGFLLENCWCLYTNWKMPRRGECPSLEDRNLTIDTDSQALEVDLYNETVLEI